MFFRLPVVRFFNRVINRATVTVALVLMQIGWLLWAFFSLTAGKVWVNAGLNVLSLFITLYLVRKDENSDYKIIWLVLIGMMPLLGGALYLAFGNKAPAKRMRQRMQAVERQHTADLAPQPGQTDALAPASRGLSRYVAEYGPYPAWKNSTAKYYPCGEAMYPDLLADLEKAERLIFLEFFIVRTGKMWKGVEDILVRKAAQGVDVRLIYDDFGSLLGLPSDFVVQMERAHIRCIPFNPVVPLLSLVMNHRDHRKIVVIDGKVAYTGGINLADEYINAITRCGNWKDAGLRFEGTAVWNFTVMFLDFWNAFRPFEQDYSAFRPQLAVLPASDGVVQPYADSPLDEVPEAETVYLDILAQAQQYVYFYTPYLAIGEEMLDALRNAAKRGGEVRLVLPGIPDKKLVVRLSRSYYLPLLRAGVRIYEYTPGFLHAKCCVSDDRAAVVGSINMDYRSMFLHFECGVLLLQNSQVLPLRDDVRRTLPQCREVQCADCRAGLVGTVLDSVLRLLSPLMKTFAHKTRAAGYTSSKACVCNAGTERERMRRYETGIALVFVLHAGGSTDIDRLWRGKLRQQLRLCERQHLCGQQRGAKRGVAHRAGGPDRDDRHRPCGQHPHRSGCRAAGCRRQAGRGNTGRVGAFSQCGQHRQGDPPHRLPPQAPERERLPTGRGVRSEKGLGRAGSCLRQLA